MLCVGLLLAYMQMCVAAWAGVPDAVFSVKAMCVCEDGGGIRGSTQILCYINAVQLGIHTHHLYMPVATCNVLYQYYLYYTTP
jgi:hypothetical protein